MTEQDLDVLVAAIAVAIFGGLAAGALLHQFHVAGHPDRQMHPLRTFTYVGMLGSMFYLGQIVATFILNVGAWITVFGLVRWLTFAAAAAVAVYLLERRRRIRKERGQ